MSGSVWLKPRLIAGYTVLCGTVTVPAGVTTPVAFETATAPSPALFDAVTATRSVLPTSAEATAYVLAFARAIAEQLFPAESQRRHSYANDVAPLHVPSVAERSCPVWGAAPP